MKLVATVIGAFAAIGALANDEAPGNIGSSTVNGPAGGARMPGDVPPRPRAPPGETIDNSPFMRDHKLDMADAKLSDEQIYKRTLACFIHGREFAKGAMAEMREATKNSEHQLNEDFALAIMSQMAVAQCSTKMKVNDVERFLNATEPLTKEETEMLFTFPDDYQPRMSTRTSEAIKKVTKDARAHADRQNSIFANLPPVGVWTWVVCLGATFILYGAFAYWRYKKEKNPLSQMSEAEMDKLVVKYARRRVLQKRKYEQVKAMAIARGEEWPESDEEEKKKEEAEDEVWAGVDLGNESQWSTDSEEEAARKKDADEDGDDDEDESDFDMDDISEEELQRRMQAILGAMGEEESSGLTGMLGEVLRKRK